MSLKLSAQKQRKVISSIVTWSVMPLFILTSSLAPLSHHKPKHLAPISSFWSQPNLSNQDRAFRVEQWFNQASIPKEEQRELFFDFGQELTSEYFSQSGYFNEERAEQLAAVVDKKNSESIPAEMHYITQQTPDLIFAMHELLANGQDTNVERLLVERYGNDPEMLDAMLKTIGRFGIGALQMFAELVDANREVIGDGIVIESRQRGSDEVVTFVFFPQEGEVRFNVGPVVKARDYPGGEFEEGTQITVLKALSESKVQERWQRTKSKFHLTVRTPIKANVLGLPKKLNNSDQYSLVQASSKSQIDSEMQFVQLGLNQQGYRIRDFGMGLTEKGIRTKLLTPKNVDKKVSSLTPKEEKEETFVRFKESQDSELVEKGVVGVWLNGRQIFQFDLQGASVLPEVHFTFPHNAGVTAEWLRLQMTPVTFRAIEEMIDQITNTENKIENREAVIYALVSLIKHPDLVSKDDEIRERLISYLKKKINPLIKENKHYLPNQSIWQNLQTKEPIGYLPEELIQIKRKNLEKISSGTLSEADIKKLGFDKGVRVYLASFKSESPSYLIHGVDNEGKWVLLDQKIWEEFKENPQLLVLRNQLLEWPERELDLLEQSEVEEEPVFLEEKEEKEIKKEKEPINFKKIFFVVAVVVVIGSIAALFYLFFDQSVLPEALAPVKERVVEAVTEAPKELPKVLPESAPSLGSASEVSTGSHSISSPSFMDDYFDVIYLSVIGLLIATFAYLVTFGSHVGRVNPVSAQNMLGNESDPFRIGNTLKQEGSVSYFDKRPIFAQVKTTFFGNIFHYIKHKLGFETMHLVRTADSFDEKGLLKRSKEMKMTGKGTTSSMTYRIDKEIFVREGEEVVLMRPPNGVIKEVRLQHAYLTKPIKVYPVEGREDMVRIPTSGDVTFEWDVEVYSQSDWETDSRLPYERFSEAEKKNFEKYFVPLIEKVTGKTIEALRDRNQTSDRQRLAAVNKIMKKNFAYDGDQDYQYDGVSWSSTFSKYYDEQKGYMGVICNGSAIYFMLLAQGLGLDALYHTARHPEGTTFYADSPGHAFASVKMNGAWRHVETTRLVPFVKTFRTVNVSFDYREFIEKVKKLFSRKEQYHDELVNKNEQKRREYANEKIKDLIQEAPAVMNVGGFQIVNRTDSEKLKRGIYRNGLPLDLIEENVAVKDVFQIGDFTYILYQEVFIQGTLTNIGNTLVQYHNKSLKRKNLGSISSDIYGKRELYNNSLPTYQIDLADNVYIKHSDKLLIYYSESGNKFVIIGEDGERKSPNYFAHNKTISFKSDGDNGFYVLTEDAQLGHKNDANLYYLDKEGEMSSGLPIKTISKVSQLKEEFSLFIAEEENVRKVYNMGHNGALQIVPTSPDIHITKIIKSYQSGDNEVVFIEVLSEKGEKRLMMVYFSKGKMIRTFVDTLKINTVYGDKGEIEIVFEKEFEERKYFSLLSINSQGQIDLNKLSKLVPNFVIKSVKTYQVAEKNFILLTFSMGGFNGLAVFEQKKEKFSQVYQKFINIKEPQIVEMNGELYLISETENPIYSSLGQSPFILDVLRYQNGRFEHIDYVEGVKAIEVLKNRGDLLYVTEEGSEAMGLYSFDVNKRDKFQLVDKGKNPKYLAESADGEKLFFLSKVTPESNENQIVVMGPDRKVERWRFLVEGGSVYKTKQIGDAVYFFVEVDGVNKQLLKYEGRSFVDITEWLLDAGDQVKGVVSVEEVGGKAFISIDVEKLDGTQSVVYAKGDRRYYFIDPDVTEMDRENNRRVHSESFSAGPSHSPMAEHLMDVVKYYSPLYYETAFHLDRHDVAPEVIYFFDHELDASTDASLKYYLFYAMSGILVSKVASPKKVYSNFLNLPPYVKDKIFTYFNTNTRSQLYHSKFYKGDFPHYFQFFRALTDEEVFSQLSEEFQVYIRILQGHKEYVLEEVTEPFGLDHPLTKTLISVPTVELVEDEGRSLAKILSILDKGFQESELTAEAFVEDLTETTISEQELKKKKAIFVTTVEAQDREGKLWTREWIQNTRDAVIKEAEELGLTEKPVAKARSYVNGHKWIASIEDAVGMDINVLLNYLLVPGASPKRELMQQLDESFTADGMFGEGFFTGVTGASEVRIYTGNGEKTYEVQLVPIYDQSGNMQDIRLISFREYQGDYKGSLIQRVHYLGQRNEIKENGVKVISSGEAMIEHAFTRIKMQKYVGAVDNIDIRWNGELINETVEVVSAEPFPLNPNKEIQLISTNTGIERVTINQLYAEEVHPELLSHPDLPHWLTKIMREKKFSLNFPKGTLPIINRTALWNRPQYAEAVKNLLLGWALKEYRSGSLEVPGLPKNVETLLNQPEKYGPGYANEVLESFLSFKDKQTGTSLWELQAQRTQERAALKRDEDRNEIDLRKLNHPLSKALMSIMIRLYQTALSDDATGRPLKIKMSQQEMLESLSNLKSYLKTGKPMYPLSLFIVDELSNGNQELKQRLDRLIQNNQIWEEIYQELSVQLPDDHLDDLFSAWEKTIVDHPDKSWSLTLEYADRYPQKFPLLTSLENGHRYFEQQLVENLKNLKPSLRLQVRRWYLSQAKPQLTLAELFPVIFSKPSNPTPLNIEPISTSLDVAL